MNAVTEATTNGAQHIPEWNVMEPIVKLLHMHKYAIILG